MFGDQGQKMLKRQRIHSGKQRHRPQRSAGQPLAGTVECLQEKVGNLPPYALLLGASLDGAYLFLELTDPRPGSILIVGSAIT